MECARLALLSALLATTTAGAGDEIPFPVRKSTTASKDGATYFVTDRMVLKKGAHVTFKQNTRIVGRGDDPTLVVEGSLTIEGQPRQEAVIENLRIVPAAQFQGIRIEWTRMESGSIEVPEGGAVSGKFSLEQTHVGGPVRLAFRAGEIRLLTSEFRDAVDLEGKGDPASKAKVRIIECSGRDQESELRRGFYRGLRIRNLPDVLVRANWITGRAAEFADCGITKFDGNTVVGCDLRFSQSAAGAFRRTKVSKTDFHQAKLIFQAPQGARPDKVVVEQCWFGGTKRPDEIFGPSVVDGRSDGECGVHVILRKVNTRPLGIGGTPVK